MERESLNITSILEHYGAVAVPQRGGWAAMKCPFHEDRLASGSVSILRGAYNCHACEAKGDAVTLIMWKEDCDYASAVGLYEEVTGQSGPRLRSKPARQRRRALSEVPVSYERDDGLFSFGIRREPPPGTRAVSRKNRNPLSD